MRFFAILLVVLREIFDESAYQRFCARQQCPPSRQSYRRFLHELEDARRKKITCC